ncbi:MAG: type II toxin-antitoxin system RelE/ParE family toxin [Gammaproteobacteria bacterium]|nr:type II toxin-antitoxin system RelE/ParE family toxin [Gammaproteobacteria bacterium]
MAGFKVRIKRSAVKEIEAISRKADRQRIVKRIRQLAEDPRPVGSQKLSGHDRYRLRQGPYRILHSIEDDALTLGVM